MSEEPASDNAQKAVSTRVGKLSPRTIVAIMALVALFVPFVIQAVITPWYSDIYIFAMTWQWQTDYWMPYMLFNPLMFIVMIPMAGLRLVFVGMVHRLYKAKTTRRRVGIIAIAAELQFVTILYSLYLLVFLLNPYYPPYFPMMIPIPLLLILGVILFRVSPPSGEPSVWRDDEKEGYWWGESEDEMDEDDEEIKIKMSDRLWSRLDSSEGNARK
ncbi:MAG: hypothetical protein ACW98Y_09495 [Candidatus Thorarchaeota archaeon]